MMKGDLSSQEENDLVIPKDSRILGISEFSKLSDSEHTLGSKTNSNSKSQRRMKISVVDGLGLFVYGMIMVGFMALGI